MKKGKKIIHFLLKVSDYILEIPPLNECDFFLNHWNQWVGSEGSETTGMSDDLAEHADKRVDWSDSGKISQVYGGISF